MTSRDDALAALSEHHARLNRAEQEEITLIAAALAAGATWNDIGQAVEQTGSNAHRKYAKHLTVERTVTVKPAQEPRMNGLAITATRAELLRAIDQGKVTEDWHNGQPGEIRHHEYGRTTRITGKARVMKAAGLCVTHPGDADLHVRSIELTDAGRKALADYDATEEKP